MAQVTEMSPDKEAVSFEDVVNQTSATVTGKSRLDKARRYSDRLALTIPPGGLGHFMLDGALLPMNEVRSIIATHLDA